MKAKTVEYDKENDILFVHNGFSEGEKYKGSVDIGNLILDMSSKMRVVGIEILNASQYLKEFLELAKARNNILDHIKDIELSISKREDNITISLLITSTKEFNKEIPAKIAIPVEGPLM